MGYGSEQPTGEASHGVYRTTPARTGKMLVIMFGIIIVGGAIFFGMWDYWISQPPPVVAMMAGDDAHAGPAVFTGDTISQDLSFIESADFRTLAFNALPGESGNNPSIQMSVGDKVVFNVENAGVSFHSFGVTVNDEGFAGIIPGSDVGSMSNALGPGEGGTSEFIAGEKGIFYYICTIPGHREMGMVGQIIVGDAVVPEVATPEPVVEAEPESVVEAEPESVVEAEPDAFTIHSEITIVTSDDSGFNMECGTDCYSPSTVTVEVGSHITFSNPVGFHTFTAGTVENNVGTPSEEFNFTLAAEETAKWIPETAGEIPYYCLFHPWMTGNITVI